MLIVQGLALYQLFSPFYLWPPKISLPEELVEPNEPLEYEVNLDPGPMGPTPKPEGSAPAATAQTQSLPDSNSAPANTPVDVQPPPSPAQMAAAVLSVSQSTPAPQPLLALEATPAPSAPDIVLVPSIDVAAMSTTEQPAEERGAANGAPANSDATSTPIRPLAMEANAAPDRMAAAPISILPGVQAPKIEPVIAANPMAIAAQQPMNPKPDLRVEQAKPSVAKPLAIAAAVQPVLTPADTASTNPSNSAPPDLRIDADVVKPSITPAAPAVSARPVMSRAPSKVNASESVRLEVASDEIGRPTMQVQGPIATSDAQASDSRADVANAGERASTNSVPKSENGPGAETQSGQSSGATGLPSDPFARAGSGKGNRDLVGQGLDAAAAQVDENGADSYERGNAFRRYHDPFADEAPNPLAGLRLREPQLFNDVLKFLVKSFGAVANDGPGHSFSGPNGGVLMEQWIRMHHSDLQRECRVQQETIDEHVRRLLCGEP